MWDGLLLLNSPMKQRVKIDGTLHGNVTEKISGTN